MGGVADKGIQRTWRGEFQIMGDSIPQEELEMGSSPYAYYAQYALDLPTDTVTTDHILNGTVTQDDLSQDLLDFIDSSITGVSEADLQAHKTEDGAHMASSISLDGGYVYISSRDLEGAIDEIDQAISTRVTDIDGVEGDVADLQGQVTQEVSDRQAGDTTLQQNINNEATTRETADNTLQQNIDDEASTRASEDAALQSNIDTEESAREAADTALDGRVDTLETTVTDLQTQITQEITDRLAGDTVLDARVDVLETTATDLQNQITQEAATRLAADTSLANDITNEASTRASADTALQTDIDSKVSKSGDTMNCSSGSDPCLTVDGNVAINGNLTAEGITVADGITALDTDVTVESDISIGDDIILGSTGSTISNNVDDQVTINDGLNVTGDMTADNLTVTDSAPSTPASNTLYKENMISAWAVVIVNVSTKDADIVSSYNIDTTQEDDAGNTCDVVYVDVSDSTDYTPPVSCDVSDNSGIYRLKFRNSMTHDDYLVTGNVLWRPDISGSDAIVQTFGYEFNSTSYFYLRTRDPASYSGDATDTASFMVQVVGGGGSVLNTDCPPDLLDLDTPLDPGCD